MNNNLGLGDEGRPLTPLTGPELPETPPFFTDFVESVYGIFFSPVRTLRAAAQRSRAPVGVGLLAFLLVVAIVGLANAATARASWQGFLDAVMDAGQFPGGQIPAADVALSGGLIALTVFLGLLWGPVGLFFKAGALNLMSSFMGGRGEASRLFALLGLTYLPALVMAPVALLSARFPRLSGLALVLSLGILVWRLILDILAIREVHGLDTGRATGVALIPLGVLIVLLIVVGAAAFAFFAALVGPMMPYGLPGVG